MSQPAAVRLARVLKVLVTIVFCCNLFTLLLVPGLSLMRTPEELLNLTQLDIVGPGGGVLLAGQPADGHVHKPGVGHVLRPVGKDQLEARPPEQLRPYLVDRLGEQYLLQFHPPFPRPVGPLRPLRFSTLSYLIFLRISNTLISMSS